MELEESIDGYLRGELLDVNKFEKYSNKEDDLELLLGSLLDNLQILSDKENFYVDRSST